MKHTEGTIKGASGLQLHFQAWLPDKDPGATLIVVHGLAEHTGRYVRLAEYFVQRGYAVYGLDHCGHGRSEGQKCYVNHFSEYINDLEIFTGVARNENPGKKLFLVGHSMGGTIAVIYAIRHQSDIAGLLLSGATIKTRNKYGQVSLPVLRILARIMPQMSTIRLNANDISRDKSVVDGYINDPLVYRGKINVRLASELFTAMSQLSADFYKITVPVLIMHGTADRLSHPAGSRRLYDKVSSPDRTLKLYDGLYHEIFNEPESGQVFTDMENWLDARLPADHF